MISETTKLRPLQRPASVEHCATRCGAVNVRKWTTRPGAALSTTRGGSQRGFRIHERNWDWQEIQVEGGTDIVFELLSEEGLDPILVRRLIS